MKGAEPPAGVTIYRVHFERMSNLDKFNYECDGQIEMTDYLKSKIKCGAVKDDDGNTAIVMDDEEEYLLNAQRCARCQHSFQCEGDFRFYCHWREDCYCIGDWADCSGYQPKGE